MPAPILIVFAWFQMLMLSRPKVITLRFRNFALQGLVIVFLAGVLCATDDWPQFRGDPQLTGVAAGVVPTTLKLLWVYEAGDSIISSAAIEDGSVFVGVQSGDLLAIDLQTGKLRWKYNAKDGIGESSPAVHDGVVYVGDLAGVLHAVRAADGKELWVFKTGAEIRSSPVVADNRVFVGSYDGSLYCLSAGKGKLLWKYATRNYIHATPAISGGVIYVAGCDEIFRGIRISDGKEVLRFPSGGYTGASPAVRDQWAYFGTFSNQVVGADLRRRRVAWQYEPADAHFPFYSSAAAAANRIVIGGRDKLIHCLSSKTGKPIWNFATGARVDSSPAIAGDRLFVGSNDGRLYELDLATGRQVWAFDAGSPLSASPAIAAGRVVIGSQDGRLYCFG